jgi:electron transport complex protein RnfE
MNEMIEKKSLGKIFMNGIINENPTFVLVLGTCPTLAVTTSVENGVGMGLAATFVLVGSNYVVSLLKNFIPDEVRIPGYVVIIATFVTVAQLLMQAYLPALNASLGLFVPLIVVNCIILARAEAFANKNTALHSVMDGLGMGIGFTLAITLISAIRELLGSGTILGYSLFGGSFEPMTIFALAPGGFIIFGLMIGIVNWVMAKFKGGVN